MRLLRLPCRSIPVLHPDTPFKGKWDLLIIALILNYVVVMPLRAAFAPTCAHAFLRPEKGGWLFFELLCDAIFMLDVALTFRTSVRLDDGTLVTDPKKIAAMYLRTWFALDVTSSFPIDLFFFFLNYAGRGVSAEEVKFVRVLRILRYTKAVRVMKLYSKNSSIAYSTVNPGAVQLVRLAIVVLAAWHFIACFYWIVARLEGWCDPPAFVYDLSEGGGGEKLRDMVAGFEYCLARWAPYRGFTEKGLKEQRGAARHRS